MTIDIGGNDVIHEDGGGVPAIAVNLPVILATLQAAAPGVPIVGMNYNDPFIPVVWFETQSLAALQAEVALTVGFNDFLESIYAAFGLEVADAESAFEVYEPHACRRDARECRCAGARGHGCAPSETSIPTRTATASWRRRSSTELDD